QAAVNYPVGTGPSSVVVGDFRGDGRSDLAVVNAVANTLSILLGNGDGTFQAAVNYPAGYQPNLAAAADLDGDGRLDLAVSNFGGTVSVLRGNGDGTFQAPVRYAAGAHGGSGAVGDFNGDGSLDLAVSNHTRAGRVTVLLNAADGRPGAPSIRPHTHLPSASRHLPVAPVGPQRTSSATVFPGGDSVHDGPGPAE